MADDTQTTPEMSESESESETEHEPVPQSRSADDDDGESEKVTYEIVRGSYYDGESIREAGDRLELDPDHVASIDEAGEKFVAVEDDPEAEKADRTRRAEAQVDTENDEAANFDLDSFMEQDYEEREEAVENGDVPDDALGPLYEQETSETVKTAIQRREKQLE